MVNFDFVKLMTKIIIEFHIKMSQRNLRKLKIEFSYWFPLFNPNRLLILSYIGCCTHKIYIYISIVTKTKRNIFIFHCSTIFPKV